MLLVSNEPSAGCTCCTRESDCDKLESWAVVKIAGYSRAVGQSRCKGRVRIGTVEGKLRGGGPGNRTRPPAWESNPAVLVEQLVDELDAVVGARAVVDLHVFGGDDEEGARQNVSCTGSVTLSGALVRTLWRIGLVRWFVEATVEETPITWHENHKAHSRKRGSSPSTDGWDVAAVWVDGLGLAARSTEHARAWRAISRGSRTSGLVPAALVARVAFCRSRPNSTDGGYASFACVCATSGPCGTSTSRATTGSIRTLKAVRLWQGLTYFLQKSSA